jgi:hypothetical protein
MMSKAPAKAAVKLKVPPKPEKTATDMLTDIQKQATGPMPAVAEPSRDEMLAAIAKHYNTTPERVFELLKVGNPASGGSPEPEEIKPSGPLVHPVMLKRAYWGPKYLMQYWARKPTLEDPVGDNRIPAGTLMKLDVEAAMRLIESGAAERRDPLRE